MKDLSILRGQIDEIDDQIVDLIYRRFKLTDEIGRLKAANLTPARDKGREERIISRIVEKSGLLSLNQELMRSIFRSILSEVVSNHKKLINPEGHNQNNY